MSPNKCQSVGERLRDCRERCALTQAQVAAALNIDRSTYSYYELGHTQPGLDTIVKLSQIFRVPVESLLSVSHDSESEVSDSHINPIYQLSKDERGLIVGYRVLSEQQRRELRKKIDEMIRKNL